MQEYRTVSGCTRAPSCNQIVSYLIISALTIAYYAAFVPLLNQPLRIPLAVTYGIILTVVTVTTLKCSSIDPVDPIMVAYRKRSRGDISSSLSECLFCESCRSYVRHDSRHCKLCNRCVQGFDHHCIWINNCIGRSNYAWFIAMVASVCLLFTFFTLSVPLLRDQLQGNDVAIPVLWAFEGLAVLTLIPLVLLLSFHVYLYCHHITTYQFFTQDRKKQKISKQTQPTRPNIWEQPSQLLEVRAGVSEVHEQLPQHMTLESLEISSESKRKRHDKKQRPTPIMTALGRNNKVMPTEVQEPEATQQLGGSSQVKSRIRSFSMKLLFGQGLQVERFETTSDKYYPRKTKVESESSGDIKEIPK